MTSVHGCLSSSWIQLVLHLSVSGASSGHLVLAAPGSSRVPTRALGTAQEDKAGQRACLSMDNCQTGVVTSRHGNQAQLPSNCDLDINMHMRGTYGVKTTEDRHGEGGHPCALRRTYSWPDSAMRGV